jgi:hypothetical protein
LERMELHATAWGGMGRHGTTREGKREPRPASDLALGTAWRCMELHGAALPIPSHSVAFPRIHTPAPPQLCHILAIIAPPAAIEIPADDPHPNRRIEQGREVKGREGKGRGNGRERRRAAQNNSGGRGRNGQAVGHGRAWNCMLPHGAAWDDTGRHGTRWDSPDLHRTWGMAVHGVAGNCMGERFLFHRILSHSLASTLPRNLMSPEFVQSRRRRGRPQFSADDPDPSRRTTREG